ncbi:helix-turn-helix domain-containing protein [Streptomyces sp. TRM68367]|uniref:helix-turn-helix domain-containing protein n=1 Tax=Streptomyces sp. TRM68367 TaxID=2758415 RepID=UPI00165AD602|nr:hypothetical protein [Streptomyces sp. TRM68367]MBC9729904.1 hypothetical protein [Streptomyces sp. TRM68367]
MTVDLAALYEVEGMSIREVAEHIGSTYTLTRKALIRAGVEFREPAVRPETLDRAEHFAELYHGGLTVRSVADRTGYAYGTVHRGLTLVQADMRDRHSRRRKAVVH